MKSAANRKNITMRILDSSTREPGYENACNVQNENENPTGSGRFNSKTNPIPKGALAFCSKNASCLKKPIAVKFRIKSRTRYAFFLFEDFSIAMPETQLNAMETTMSTMRFGSPHV